MRFLFVASCLIATSVASATDYTIDSDHSNVGFKVKHLAISSVTGRFAEFQGEFSFDPANVSASTVKASIVSRSIDTRQAKRDDHLRSPEFFDAAKFPALKFESSSVTAKSENEFAVNGTLTIRDVSKPVTLDVVYGGAATDPWGNQRAAFTATAKVNRKDFGMTYNKLLETGGLVVGDEVAIELEIEGIKKKS